MVALTSKRATAPPAHTKGSACCHIVGQWTVRDTATSASTASESYVNKHCSYQRKCNPKWQWGEMRRREPHPKGCVGAPRDERHWRTLPPQSCGDTLTQWVAPLQPEKTGARNDHSRACTHHCNRSTSYHTVCRTRQYWGHHAVVGEVALQQPQPPERRRPETKLFWKEQPKNERIPLGANMTAPLKGEE